MPHPSISLAKEIGWACSKSCRTYLPPFARTIMFLPARWMPSDRSLGFIHPR